MVKEFFKVKIIWYEIYNLYTYIYSCVILYLPLFPIIFNTIT